MARDTLGPIEALRGKALLGAARLTRRALKLLARRAGPGGGIYLANAGVDVERLT